MTVPHRVLCVCLLGWLVLSGHAREPLLDPYGGFLNIAGEATGAFHVEKIRGRYWFVTPDGHAFLSLGVNHVLALSGSDPYGVFKKQYGGDWDRASRKVVEDFRLWGFNTAGYMSPRQLWDALPFVAWENGFAPVSAWQPADRFRYVDVFDPAVQEEIRGKVEAMCLAARSHPNLIGYYWTDIPRWNLQKARKHRHTDWVSSIRRLEASAPGKRRYIQFLEQRYHGDINALNRVYARRARSFSDLLSDPFHGLDLRHREVAGDDQVFLGVIAEALYGVLGKANRRYDPDHLVLGERYLLGDHPDAVLRAALPYIDVLSIQPGGVAFLEEHWDRLHQATGKPILICDHQSSFPTDAYPDTMWKQVADEEAAGRAYQDYLTKAFARPYIVGYQRCQYIDRVQAGRGRLKQGLLRQDETPYAILVDYVRRTNLAVIRHFAAPERDGGRMPPR